MSVVHEKMVDFCRQQPGAADDAEVVRGLMHDLLAGRMSAQAFDAAVGPKRFAVARFLWGLDDEDYRLAQPIVERRWRSHEARRRAAEASLPF